MKSVELNFLKDIQSALATVPLTSQLRLELSLSEVSSMDDLVWCSSCGLSASLAQAITESPCSRCGSRSYFCVTSAAEEDALLSLAERMQRVGEWDVSETAFRRCYASGYISAADLNLSLSQLSFRRECADAACALIRSSSSALTVSDLRSLLLSEYDDFTVSWLLSDYSGLRLVPFDSTYIVEVANAS